MLQSGFDNLGVRLQGGVRALLAIDANFGELAFERESAAEAEARVTRHAREIAAQLSERARREARKLPFARCAIQLLPSDHRAWQHSLDVWLYISEGPSSWTLVSCGN